MRDSQPESLLAEFKKGHLVRFGNHELILRAGESPKGVYYLSSGFVKVYSITDHGVENIHIIYKVGDIFPLIWTFKDVVRSVFYESLGTSKLYILRKDDFLELNRLSHEFTRQLLYQSVEQFSVYADRLDNLEYTDASERVAYRLMFLAGRFGRRVGNKILIDAPITHQHIADSINLARETVSREIERLERKGLVGHQRRKLVLNNLEGLRSITGEPPSADLWGLK